MSWPRWPTHSWVHLACHASQQQADPARSGFALWDGTLTITDLAAQPTQHRDLAFLSACQTATGSIRHLDEAIHLAAAMQFLGYRHVIATMWTIADPPAPRIADTVYTALTEDGQPDPPEPPKPSTTPSELSAKPTPPTRCYGRRTSTSAADATAALDPDHRAGQAQTRVAKAGHPGRQAARQPGTGPSQASAGP